MKARHRVAYCTAVNLGYLEIPQSLGKFWSNWKSFRTKLVMRISIQKHRCVPYLLRSQLGNSAAAVFLSVHHAVVNPACDFGLFPGAPRGLAP